MNLDDCFTAEGVVLENKPKLHFTLERIEQEYLDNLEEEIRNYIDKEKRNDKKP